ncbi:MAG: AMP-binding protein, partial [Deltaproteobacteria bacterium]
MEWRLIHNAEGEVADLLALPAAVAEARVAGRYILTSKPIPETIIIQGVQRKGILVGAEVVVDREEAQREGIEIATQPRRGRGGARPADTISLQDLMLKAKDKFTSADCQPDETAALIYTSGTTGNPKGVMLTHGNFLAECEATSEIITTTEDDRFATLVPFFHIYGLAVGLVVSFFRGCSTVLFPQYSPRQCLKRMGEEKISILIAIPTQYDHLLLAARRGTFAQPSLKYCISGAAPLPVKIIQVFKEAFGVDIIEGYGLTETTAAVAVNPQERTKPGSVGVPVKGVQIKIGDSQGNALPPNKAGEVFVKGEVVMKGYYNLPQETLQSLRDGWLHTGDIGYQDEEGYLYITERKKDIIIKGGFNISPAEIEELLCAHPKVKDAAVVGQKEKGGREEAVKAFIVPAEGEEITPSELIGYCRTRLAPYKVPDEIEFREGLPKSATGKVLRK